MNRLLLPFLLLLFALAACQDASDSTGEETTTAATAEGPGEENYDGLPDNPVPGRKYRGPDGKTHMVIEATPWPVGQDDYYPAAPGFNEAGSDRRAIMVADSVVKHHGGYTAYENIRYLTWTFFGRRTLTWDKLAQRVRIESPGDETIYLLDYSGEAPAGRVRIAGEEVTDSIALAEALAKANSIFINDSYWLVQQFKLKDSGVTLKHLEDSVIDPQATRPCHVLELTFDAVGDTPQNKYHLYVDMATYRINTWQFFRNATDEEPAMETSWENYLPYEGIALSGRRSDFSLEPIGVAYEKADKVFTEF